jgi:hypothetical protein
MNFSYANATPVEMRYTRINVFDSLKPQRERERMEGRVARDIII